MIEKLELQAYGCVKDASFVLSPLHALIGPNDSGKSTLLRALRTIMQFGGGDFGPEPTNAPAPFNPMLKSSDPSTHLAIHLSNGLSYALSTDKALFESVHEGSSQIGRSNGRSWNVPGYLHSVPGEPKIDEVRKHVVPAVMFRLDPNAMRMPSPQLLADMPVRFLDELGSGLASVYQAINSRDVDAFVTLRDQVRKLFPTLKTLRTPSLPQGYVTLQAELNDGTVVNADAMSEGLLYYLAFAALPLLAPSTLLLIEEPENGLHPSRIREVMQVLREVSKTMQVVLATHSPLVINELEGQEVSVLTRTEADGTRATLLRDTFNYEVRSKIYANGELWLSYADGKLEHDLLHEPEPA